MRPDATPFWVFAIIFEGLMRLSGFLVFLSFSVSLTAQVTTGSISGFVFDPGEKPVSKAKITASDPARAITRETVSDASGFYRFADLPPSRYTVSSSAPQFEEVRIPDVTVAVNSHVRMDVRLPLAGMRQVVTVSGRVSALQSESSDLGAVIDETRIRQLPLNRRDFLQLSLLTPGVLTPVQNSELSTRGSFAMHANGAREEFNTFLLDGVDNNDQNVNRYVLQPSVDAIQEFKISTNSYSAEYGRSAGAQVNVVTRSGTNDYHGFGYEYLRNRKLDARNFFDGLEPSKYIRNQFGAGAGGPLVKDRAFFFGSFDGLRERRGLPRIGSVPAAALRAGDLSSLTSPVVDPFTRAPFPGNRIPETRIAPLARKIIDLFPMPNLPGFSGNYLAQPVQRDAQTQFNARIDYRLADTGQLAIRYSYGKKKLFEPFAEDSTDIPGFGDYLNDGGHNAMVQHVHTFGPSAVNSFTAGLNRATRQVLPENYTTDVNALWGVDYLPTRPRDFGFPGITVAGFSRIGDVTQLPIDRAANTYQVTDIVSIIRGNHGIKFGGEMRRMQFNGILDLLARGTMSFPGAISGAGIGDLLLGFPALGIQSQADNTQTQRTTAYNFFAQDDWKVRPSLTLNLGLRYEYNTPVVDPTDRMTVFNLETRTIARVGTGGVTRSGYRADRNNLAPRFGVAWTPAPKTVLRAGYGVFYDSSMTVVNSALYFNPPYFNIRVFFPTQTSLLTLSDPFPIRGGITPPPSLSTLDPNLSTAYLQHWNFNVQREFAAAGVVSIAYAGSRGAHLIRSRDLNQPRPGPGDIPSRAPYSGFSNIFISETGGNSNYHSLQASVTRPLGGGLSLLAAYTFSKSIDDTSAFLRTGSDPNFPQDSQNYRAERALSSFDTRHRAAIAYMYRLPGRSWWNRNTETRGIITAQTGQPFTPILRFDNSNTGNTGGNFGSDRPNVVGSPGLSNPSANLWFDTAAFAVPAQYTFGSAGRNIVTGPGFTSIDLSLYRQFRVGEHQTIALEGQLFNTLNHTNLDLPERFADEPGTFGRIFSAKPPRQLQVALRFQF
jgi:outer membrane receptor protein involved in Fe transport